MTGVLTALILEVIATRTNYANRLRLGNETALRFGRHEPATEHRR